MSTYPSDRPDFTGVYGASAEDCIAANDPQIIAVAEQYQASVDAGRMIYDAGAAQDCLDDENGYSCDEYWTVPESDACEQIFVGTVATGGECDFSAECANLAEICDLGTCQAP